MKMKLLRNTKQNCENKLKICAINADKDFQQKIFCLIFHFNFLSSVLMCETMDDKRGNEQLLKSCFIVFKVY
jgi:hypothetical protein